MVLDEPTVGVDPLLRKSIWKHLTEISRSDRLTVLITTHYIEEAKDANLVGLMRHGRILEQNSPRRLIEKYQLESLEQVFLHLCSSDENALSQRQEFQIDEQDNSKRSTSVSSSGIDSIDVPTSSSTSTEFQKLEPFQKNKVNAFKQIGAIVKKNLLSLVRNPGLFFTINFKIKSL